MDNKFDLTEIGSILDLLTKNDVREFKLERDNDKLWLKRGPNEVSQIMGYAPQPAQYQLPQYQLPQYAGPQAAAAPQASGAVSSNEITPPQKAPASNLKEIKSPMVGTFYRRPAVDAQPYVAVGDVIKKGQVLCIVEAMKLMNEIESDAAGRVTEVCLDDAQMVEYGEVMFRIEPV